MKALSVLELASFYLINTINSKLLSYSLYENPCSIFMNMLSILFNSFCITIISDNIYMINDFSIMPLHFFSVSDVVGIFYTWYVLSPTLPTTLILDHGNSIFLSILTMDHVNSSLFVNMVL